MVFKFLGPACVFFGFSYNIPHWEGVSGVRATGVKWKGKRAFPFLLGGPIPSGFFLHFFLHLASQLNKFPSGTAP